jgi:ubiquinone/menaquinone biosynthesis C-methylase UbiE
MFERFAQRSYRLERLDTGDYTAAEYAKWQSEMKLINRWLGDARALRLSLATELETCGDYVSILDVGAGSGELLKTAKEAIWNRSTYLVGAELNASAARSISKRSFGVSSVQCDALVLPFADKSFDFIISSLFLHHLNDTQALQFIKEMSRVARKRFYIIDLHRHPAAYYIYRLFGRLFLQRFTLEDGSLSILRSFRPAELRRLAESAGIKDPKVTRYAAFRLVLSGSKN